MLAERTTRITRRRLLRIAGALAVAAVPFLPQAARANQDVPPGTVSVLPQSIPNYYVQHAASPGDGYGKVLASFVDEPNHLLFEETGAPCYTYEPIGPKNLPNLIEYDTVTYAEKAAICMPETSAQFHYKWKRLFPYTGSETPLAAVSPTSKMVFLADTYDFFGDNPTMPSSQVIAIQESPFRVAATWPLPSDALPQIAGFSWYAPTNSLEVLTTYGFNDNSTPGVTGPPGVAVSELSAATGAPRGPSWEASAQDCPHTLTPLYASASAYRGSGAIYVPCDRNPGSSGQGTATPAILKARLLRPDCPGICVTGTPTVVPPPYKAFDFLFDPSSERGFMPSPVAGENTLEAYDGKQSQFLSLTNASGSGQTAFGIDTATGRVYAVGTTGITLIDARRTPLAPGQSFASGKIALISQQVPILSADSSHPYARVFVPVQPCNCAPPKLVVFADSVGVSQDPPASAVDKNTTSGPIPAGADVNKTFTGSARGYGFHVDFVGSIDQVLVNNNVNGMDGIVPFGGGTRDLMGASVSRLTRTDGGAQAQASALEDGSGSTQLEYLRCTDLRSVRSCSQPQVVCQVANLPSDNCELPDQPPNRPNTEQAWPFQDAMCSRPALHSSDQPETAGAFVTTSYDPNTGAPVQTLVPGSDKVAAAQVGCNGDAIHGTASMAGQALSQGPVSLSVTSAHTDSTVTPPGTTDLVVSDSMSEATGVNIDLPGVATLDIGRVTAHAVSKAGGRAGTATTTLAREISDVTITQGGTARHLCGDSASCADNIQQVLANINAAFAGHLAIFSPAPDDEFGGPGSKTGNGSPGGYTAVVQANIPEQYGDHQFNGMAPEEATYLPTLRIVAFDDSSQLSRVVTDLAGVEADSEYGLQAVGGDQFQGVFTADQTSCPAGANPDSGPGAGTFLQACASDLTLTAADSTDFSGDNASSGGGGGGTGGGLEQLIVQVFKGFDWLRRNPVAALQMFTFLMLLGLPLVLMARRRMLEEQL